MNIPRPRSFACMVAALALVAVAAPAVPASASPKGKHHIFRFGTRPLVKGAKGKDVRFLQRALSRLGVATSIDGVFGKGTLRSVEAFEQQHAWPVNGIISKKDAKRIKKLLTNRRVTGGYFVEGYANPTLNLASRKAGTAKVKVLNATGGAVAASVVSFGGAQSEAVPWNGTLASGIAPDGIYELRLADPGTAKASVTGGQTQPFAMHLHQFPVPGPHTYGGPDGRFGAPRSGHIHQGQDLPAACGEKLYVFEKGQVRVNAYQAGGAGYYVVLDGKNDNHDYFYAHLRRPASVREGEHVRTGERIGVVGSTGDATGCHLHFEVWKGDWWGGGHPLPAVTKILKRWDRWS
jgi:murein DD-endopeptidase MepM/ murein hydrolase activator NlpD